MSVLGVPAMSKTTFIQTERDIGELWEQEMEKAMLEAGKEEKRLAKRKVTITKVCQLSLSLSMVVDQNVHISIRIMQNPEWVS